MRVRICDVGDCDDAALFAVSVYDEAGSERLFDSADVCGAEHAKEQIKVWLKVLADNTDEPELPEMGQAEYAQR